MLPERSTDLGIFVPNKTYTLYIHLSNLEIKWDEINDKIKLYLVKDPLYTISLYTIL